MIVGTWDDELLPEPDTLTHPVARLAVHVIWRAMLDFGVVTEWRGKKMPKEIRIQGDPNSGMWHAGITGSYKARRTHAKQLLAIHICEARIDGGRFLLEREDELTRFWFEAAGMNVYAFRDRLSATQLREWRLRLRALRARLQHLNQEHMRRIDRDRSARKRQRLAFV